MVDFVIGDAVENIGEPGFRINTVELGGLCRIANYAELLGGVRLSHDFAGYRRESVPLSFGIVLTGYPSGKQSITRLLSVALTAPVALLDRYCRPLPELACAARGKLCRVDCKRITIVVGQDQSVRHSSLFGINDQAQWCRSAGLVD